MEVALADQEKTTFATPFGLYLFEFMPFGVCSAPAMFQRLMQPCLGMQVYDSLPIYLDDVIVYTADFTTHLQHSGAGILPSYSGYSLDGLGAVLAQVQKGKEKMIADACCSLHASECNDQNDIAPSS